VRIDQRRIVKKIFKSEPEGSRSRRRPRLRWLEDIEGRWLLRDGESRQLIWKKTGVLI